MDDAPKNCRKFDELIAEQERDPVKKALLDKAREELRRNPPELTVTNIDHWLQPPK
jgi:hypothetical protein